MIRIKKEDFINWLILGFIFYLYAQWVYPTFIAVFIINEAVLFYSFPIFLWINRRTFLSVLNPMITIRFKSKLSILFLGWIKVISFVGCLVVPLIVTGSVQFESGLMIYVFLCAYYTLMFSISILLECYLGYTKGISLFSFAYCLIYLFLYYMVGLLFTIENISFGLILFFFGMSGILFILIVKKLRGEKNYEKS